MWCYAFVVTLLLPPCDELSRFARSVRHTPWAEQVAVVPEGNGAQAEAMALEQRIVNQLAT